MHLVGDFADRVDLAENIGDMRHADQPGPVAQQTIKLIRFKGPAVLVHRPGLDDDAAVAKPHPRTDIAFMISAGHDNLVAL